MHTDTSYHASFLECVWVCVWESMLVCPTKVQSCFSLPLIILMEMLQSGICANLSGGSGWLWICLACRGIAVQEERNTFFFWAPHKSPAVELWVTDSKHTLPLYTIPYTVHALRRTRPFSVGLITYTNVIELVSLN